MKGYTDRELARLVAQGRRAIRIPGTTSQLHRLTPGEIEYLLELAERDAAERRDGKQPA